MISKYNDFLLEKSVINLILEKELTCSPEFLDRLGLISNQSEIADVLYSAFDWNIDVDKNLPQNWIDVTEIDDMITFLPDSKYTDSDIDDDISPFSIKGRSQIKVGRFVRALLSNKDVIKELEDNTSFTDNDYEKFVNLYKSTFKPSNIKFKLVSGIEIKKYYLEDNYAYVNGQLGSSCMRYDDCQDYFEIYTENSESCRLLIYVNSDDKILGRALVWKLSQSPCESEYFMDRVYTSKDSDVIKFINYANENGWMYKFSMCCDNSEGILFKYKKKTIIGEIRIKLSKSKFDEYPFMDTVSYINLKDGFASNVNGRKFISCLDTSGEYNDECANCNGEGIADNKCDNCLGDGCIECDDCEGEGSINCTECDASNIIDCDICDGTGRARKLIRMGNCSRCEGSGKISNCSSCNGNKYIDCAYCNGTGTKECDDCNGYGVLRKQPCENCVNYYKSMLNLWKFRPTSESKYKEIPELASMEIDRLEKSKKKETKKKKGK